MDALRGLSCLFVVIHHLFAGLYPEAAQHVLAAHSEPLTLAIQQTLVSFSALRVALFLSLSGFCLFWPVLRKHPLCEVRVDYRQFMVRRARRILPPYYIALLLFILYELLVPSRVTGEYLGGIKSFVAHVFLFHNLSFHMLGAINGSFWSLAVEWQMYLAFPLFLWLVRRGGEQRGIPLLLGVALAVAVAWRLFAIHHVGSPSDWRQNTVWYRSAFDYCWYFALGMAAAFLVANSRYAMLRVWVIAVGTASFLPAIYLGLHPFPLSPANFFWGLGIAGLLVGTSSVRPGVFRPRGVLHPLTWLGTCSYSVYLVHQPIVHLIRNLVSHQTALIITLPIALGAGYLFHLAFERPFMPKPGQSAPKTERQAEVAAVVSPAP